MPLTKTEFPGLFVFDPLVIEDNRGYFFESYNQKVLKDSGIEFLCVQENQSFSHYGTIRGLHYQLNPYSQTKMVRAISGIVWDVALDLRKGSPTFGTCFGIELSADNKRQLIIPKGFAHGFSILSESAIVNYKCDEFYNREFERGIRMDDPFLAIDWKIPSEKFILSDKDKKSPFFHESENNFIFEG